MSRGLASPFIATSRLRWILLVIAAVAAFALLADKRVGGIRPGCEYDIDCYYHVAMADSAPQGCLQRTFPATDASIWKERFYDKELLFHLGLGLLRKCEAVLGGDMGPPFHFPVLFFAGLLLLAFGWVCWRLDPRGAWLWLWPLVVLSPTFASRCIMLRPQVLSITLMVLASYGFTRIRAARGLWLVVRRVDRTKRATLIETVTPHGYTGLRGGRGEAFTGSCSHRTGDVA